jgi:hypothetical protein
LISGDCFIFFEHFRLFCGQAHRRDCPPEGGEAQRQPEPLLQLAEGRIGGLGDGGADRLGVRGPDTGARARRSRLGLPGRLSALLEPQDIPPESLLRVAIYCPGIG